MNAKISKATKRAKIAAASAMVEGWFYGNPDLIGEAARLRMVIRKDISRLSRTGSY